MSDARVARPYAAALLLTAEAVGTVQAVGSDLEAVGRALEGSNELRLLMASPVVRPAGRQLS